MTSRHISPRGSAVAPALAAPSTVAGVCFAVFARFASSQSTRCVPPSSQRSSPAGKSLAGLLFQFTSSPFDGLVSCGCLLCATEPFHSNLPRPSTGRSSLTPLGRTRQPARGDERDVLRVGVERVERLRRGRRRADEVPRGLHPPERQVLEEDLVVRLAAGARALARQRHHALGARDPGVADHRAVDRAAEAHLHGLVALADRARLDRLHLAAAALVAVLRPRAAAELLGVRVDDVGAGRGQRPREARAAADQQVAGERRGGRAARRGAFGP